MQQRRRHQHRGRRQRPGTARLSSRGGQQARSRSGTAAASTTAQAVISSVVTVSGSGPISSRTVSAPRSPDGRIQLICCRCAQPATMSGLTSTVAAPAAIAQRASRGRGRRASSTSRVTAAPPRRQRHGDRVRRHQQHAEDVEQAQHRQPGRVGQQPAPLAAAVQHPEQEVAGRHRERGDDRVGPGVLGEPADLRQHREHRPATSPAARPASRWPIATTPAVAAAMASADGSQVVSSPVPASRTTGHIST